jgi:hypothetical protein
MELYPQITSVTAGINAAPTLCNVDIRSAADGSVLATIQVSVATVTFGCVRDAILDAVLTWKGAQSGDPVQAMQDMVSGYTDADWRRWGI